MCVIFLYFHSNVTRCSHVVVDDNDGNDDDVQLAGQLSLALFATRAMT